MKLKKERGNQVIGAIGYQESSGNSMIDRKNTFAAAAS